jgi:hypothetical protein
VEEEAEKTGLKALDDFVVRGSKLYWKNREVVTTLRLSLGWWGNLLGSLAALAALGTFVILVLQTAHILPTEQVKVVVQVQTPEGSTVKTSP